MPQKKMPQNDRNGASTPEGPLSPDTIRDQTAALANHLQRIGVQWLPSPDPERVAQWATEFQTESDKSQDSKAPGTPGRQPNTGTPAASDQPSGDFALDGGQIATTATSYPGAALPLQQRSESLAGYAEKVAACTRCELLARCRTQTVFGEGNVTPRIVFFGEAPGRDEDLEGRPFVGKAGQLLTKMIQACKFDREDVYIMNTVKCRPPNNRNPEPTELENCREYFEAQLNILRPEYIVCLGLVSAQTLLRTKLSVGRLRGKFHSHFDSKVLVTYHPAYLLRAPAAKKAAWEDLQLMLRDAGLM